MQAAAVAILCRLWGWKGKRRGREREVERDTLPGLKLRQEQTCGGAAESSTDTIVWHFEGVENQIEALEIRYIESD